MSRGRVLVLALALLLGAATRAAAGDAAFLGLRVHSDRERSTTVGDVVGGRPALVAVLASYCPPCRAEVPVLGRAARRWRDVRMLAVLTDVEDADDLRRVVQTWGIDVDAYAVASGQETLLESLLPAGLPATFYVRQGSITRHDRILTDDDLERLVPRLLLPEPGDVSPSCSVRLAR